ncbi:MAG: hypothetical protein QNJ38_03590 [Prochloraceae cyanobacterium]|nr:hypothetical protein [Prochloraceae cyanobacterium]
MMDSLNLKVPESVSFEEAIAATESLLGQMENGKLTEAEIQESIESLVKSKNGARGFFVTYLTDDRNLADNPTEAVVNALKTSPEIVGELLVKNLAMSAGMSVTHRRNNNETMAKSSQRVTKRNGNLIQLTNLDLVSQELKKMRESALTGEGEYQEFIKRWGYDEEQRKVIEKALSEIIK